MSDLRKRPAGQTEQSAQPAGSYPNFLAGQDAPPPAELPAEYVAAWRQYEAEEAAELEDGPLVAAAGQWRMARSLQVLLAEADAANPRRDKRSDGGIGDPRHQARAEDSDHNPWLQVAGTGVVRARDFDADGLELAAAFERMRAKAARGELPQLLHGGYLIHAGRITRPDFSGWSEYLGENPHATFGHVSVSRTPERFDSEQPWNVWTKEPAAPSGPSKPASKPKPAAPRGWTGPDLRGRSVQLRGEQGANGPRVRALQRFLRRTFPLYAKQLEDDGWWGPATSTVLRQFGQRSGVRSADGSNIGPQLGRKLFLAGFRG